MTNYDFLNLSPLEFESLSRDLLQKRQEVFIESFTTGRDSGIDLRFAKGNGGNTIIQAKRFKEYNSLFNHLKKEVDKVKKLAPDNYIITTSVGLTPANKDAVKDLFAPYIKETSDILGKDDLNNLLANNGDIERTYYKLWLSSTNVLTKILHSRIYNQTAFELEEIQSKVKLYVQNASFTRALDILKVNRYLIISGIPGIGKTTLSEILILHLLSTGYDEFVYLSRSIDDGYEYFADGKKQVFFFDDFLGKNSFEFSKSNEDSKIVKFIEKIKRSPDKILIFATREYILNQALNVYEIFRINNIEIAKCVLDLSVYTKLIQAQIIYNHLYFANVPISYLEDLVAQIQNDWLKRKKYTLLIGHPNYNPRIIETIIKRKIWTYCQPEQFTTAFKSFLDYPESVWLYAFENSLDKFSQYALVVLLSMGTPVKIQDWEMALKSFLTINSYKYQIPFDSIIFERALRELENTFIKTRKDSYTTIAVEYQNPSIQDFLVNYLKNKSDLINSIISSAIYSDEFFSVFSMTESSDTREGRKICLDENQLKSFAKRLQDISTELVSCRALQHTYGKIDKRFFWSTNSNFKYGFWKKVYEEFADKDLPILDLVYAQFQKNIYIDDLSYSEQRAYIYLIRELDKSKLDFNEERLLALHLERVTWLDNLEIFFEFKSIFPLTYEKVISDSDFNKKISEVVATEISSVENSDLGSLINQIELIETLYNVKMKEELVDLENREKKYVEELEAEDDSNVEDRIYESKSNSEMSEGRVIEEIFNSLIDGQ